ncbi:MAG: hypothetical protein M9894_37110 [Planctomycetes bacterium]|nr:hypothetical protein [Planctomycetota bacterium]
MKQNMALRLGSGRSARGQPRPRPRRRRGAAPAPAPALRGGGLLGALVAQNLAVRTTRTPPAQGRARAA